jgi:integrase
MTRQNDNKPALTVNDAIARYLASRQNFGRLAPATQKIHRSHLRRFAALHGTSSFAAIDAGIIAEYLDAQASEHVGRAAHKVLRSFFRFGVKMRWRAEDPTKQVDAPKVKAGGGRAAWSDGELRAYEAAHPIGTMARLCFALALYTAQRRGDLRKMRHADFVDGTLYVKQQKTGTELYLPVSAELERIIAASPCGREFLLATKTGRQYSANDLSDQFRQWCRAAGLPARCTLHGLRATALTRLADADCTVHQIAAVSGHKSLAEVQRYTRGSNQRSLARAAMAKIFGAARFDGVASKRLTLSPVSDQQSPEDTKRAIVSAYVARMNQKYGTEAYRQVRRV